MASWRERHLSRPLEQHYEMQGMLDGYAVTSAKSVIALKHNPVQRFPPRDMHDPSSNGVRARATMPKRSDATVITGSNSEEEVLYECSFLIGLRLGEYIAALRNLAHPDVAHSEEGAVLQAKQHSPISSCLSPSPTLLFLFPFSSLSPAEDNAPRNCFAPIKKLC